jgi:hypothetical protein
MIKIIHDITTNKITEVELTDTEIKKRQEKQVIREKELAKEEAEAEAKATARAAILDRLGLTAAEAAILLG